MPMISITEVCVMNEPKGMKDWRLFRIEYPNGKESHIWTPPWVTIETIDRFQDNLNVGFLCRIDGGRDGSGLMF